MASGTILRKNALEFVATRAHSGCVAGKSDSSDRDTDASAVWEPASGDPNTICCSGASVASSCTSTPSTSSERRNGEVLRRRNEKHQHRRCYSTRDIIRRTYGWIAAGSATPCARCSRPHDHCWPLMRSSMRRARARRRGWGGAGGRLAWGTG